MSAHPRRVLIKGGYVLTVDPAIGELGRGDLLIEDDLIVQVAPHIEAMDSGVTTILDYSHCIHSPSMPTGLCRACLPS